TDGIDIADLAAPDPWQRQVAGEHRVHSVMLSRNGGAGERAVESGLPRDSSLRQRNELVLLRNLGKTAGFPVLFGLLDPLLAGGNAIPPDVARALQRVAAEEHHPRRLGRLHRDAITWTEDQQARRFIALVRNLD